MFSTHSFKLFAVCCLGVFATSTQAGTISCGDSYRNATLSSATACYAQTLGSTAKADDLSTITGSNWTQVGALNANGSNNWFSVTSSSWGTTASGSWTINDLFWDNFTSALITMHVGGGEKKAVDNFEWLITPDSLSGTFDYTKLVGKGGGLSNIKLWGMGTVQKDPAPVPTNTVHVPESATLSLFALGLLGLIFMRRKPAIH